MLAEKRHARSAQLRYVNDSVGGIERKKNGRGFQYLRKNKRLRDPSTLRRIQELAIPPAWRDVWICPYPNGHIQAIGRDERGRKQYCYHARWRSVRDEAKYDRIKEFAAVLPQIRKAVGRDLRAVGLPKRKVTALVVRLLETSRIRVGNEEYAQQNGSFGLTTLKDHHAKFRGGSIHFHFRGKSKQWHDVEIHDKRLARMVRACQDLPGQQLFQYRDENGATAGVSSNDINDYIREIAGDDFSAKDFRTWIGTVRAACALRHTGCCENPTDMKRAIVAAIRDVAMELGNTPAVCRKAYIHPGIIEAYENGRVAKSRKRARGGLSADECAVLALLQH